MGKIRDTITFIVAIILFSAPLSVILVFGESNVKWWWLLGYYLIVIISSFALMGIEHSVLQDLGRDMAKVPLIFVLGCTSPIIIIIFISSYAIRFTGHDVPGFIWAGFYVFAFVIGYQKFKEREETFVMLKKPKRKEEKFVGKKKSKLATAVSQMSLKLTLSRIGRLEAALNRHNKELEIDPRDEKALYKKGIVLYNLGSLEEATKCYDRILEIDPRCEKAWDKKGIILSYLDRLEEAIKCYDKALEINPKFVLSLDSKGVALARLGRFEEAIECFDKALEINPTYKMAKTNRELALEMQMQKKNYHSLKKSDTKTYSNDKYGFSIKYPKNWALDILDSKPEFTVELNVWFGIRGKVACSIMVGPIGPTIYGRTLKELENRARIHRQNLNANLLSSKRLTISGVEAYEHKYTAEYPRRYVKQAGLFKDNDEYLLLFKVFSKENFEKYESTFDECIQSFKFKREDRKQNIKKDDKGVETRWDPVYG